MTWSADKDQFEPNVNNTTISANLPHPQRHEMLSIAYISQRLLLGIFST